MTKAEFIKHLDETYTYFIDTAEYVDVINEYQAERDSMLEFARAYVPEPPQPTSMEKPFKLNVGDGYKTRDGHDAIVARLIDDKSVAYGVIMLKSGLRTTVWRAVDGGKVYSKTSIPNKHDIVSRETI